MKTIFACGLCCVLVGVGLAIAADDKQCQKPNPSTKACYEPDNQTASCTDLTIGECGQVDALKMYEIEQFPDGVIKTAEGATKTESTKCWRTKSCFWNPQQSPPGCVPNDIWINWILGQKTVENPDAECPIPEAG
ncbi:MAG TPA: hypothetical protein DEB39_05030 [Planctomycetaceae bacterium]|nr:hypothetical protein [Planctomycetaceae bacterium]